MKAIETIAKTIVKKGYKYEKEKSILRTYKPAKINNLNSKTK